MMTAACMFRGRPGNGGPMASDSAARLQEFAAHAQRAGDLAGICRIALFNEVRANQPDATRQWFEVAARQDHIPALHELARLDTLDSNFASAHERLRRINDLVQRQQATPAAPRRPS